MVVIYTCNVKRLSSQFTFVLRTGDAKIRDNPQTTKSDRRQLVIVHRDLDLMGITMTMNLSTVTAKRLRIDETADNTREYSATLQADPSVSNCLAKYCTSSIGAATKSSSKSAT